MLDSLGLAKVKQTLADNDVDYEMFLKLTEEDFKELGLTIGARKKLTSAIKEIKGTKVSIETPNEVGKISPGAHKSLSSVISPISPTKWVNNVSEWGVKSGFSSKFCLKLSLVSHH